MSESYKPNHSISIDTDKQIIQFKRNRSEQRCNHRNVKIFKDESEIDCVDCGQKINPIHWILAHLSHINSASRKNRAYLAEWQVIESKLKGKNKFLCTHCHEVNTIDFKRLPSQSAVTRKLNVIESEKSDDYTIEEGKL